MRLAILVPLVLTLAAACQPQRPRSTPAERMQAASSLTQRYAQSALAQWHVHGQAAGTDCGVLIVETPIMLEDTLVEALHTGAGGYDVYSGGVQQYSRDRAFRGVAYRDRSRRIWRFGDVRSTEALTPCR